MTAPASSRCPACGTESLDEDDGMVICTTCGKVIQDAGVVQHDQSQNTGMSNPVTSFMSCNKMSDRMRTDAIRQRSSESNEISSDARKVCSSVIDQLANKLCFTRDMRQELKKYVKEALDGDYYRSMRKKMISIAAICAYITMIKNGKPVTISEVCSITDCEKQDFASMYYKYLSHNPHNHPGLQQLDQLIPCSLKTVSFEESEKVRIFKVTHSLLSLMDQVMLIESKSPTYLILAAAFIAWKTLHRSRSAVTFAKFRLITKIPSDMKLSRVLFFVKQLEDKLISLCVSIPWFTHTKIKRSALSHHVPEILEFKHSIVYDHKQLVSECSIKSEPKVIEQVPDVDGDQEISDSEIDAYIRSPAEVRAVKRLKVACRDQDDM